MICVAFTTDPQFCVCVLLNTIDTDKCFCTEWVFSAFVSPNLFDCSSEGDGEESVQPVSLLLELALLFLKFSFVLFVACSIFPE